MFTLENLNTAVDHPGTPFARAADTRALVAAVDSPHLRMNLDLYHAQIGEGNLTELVHTSVDLVGEIQVADVPGRCEPGTGEINYPHLGNALREAGYEGSRGPRGLGVDGQRPGAGTLPAGVHATSHRTFGRRAGRSEGSRRSAHVSDVRRIGVGVVGAGWMGHTHSRAYLRVPHHYPDLPVRPVLAALAEPVATLREDAVARYEYAAGYSDWQELLADPAVEVVSVATPPFLHAQIGEAVARAGKHLWIEKPVGHSVEDTERVAVAVTEAGVCARVGYNYRHVPAVAKARALLTDGAIGRVTHGRFRMFTDYAAHPLGALSWRFESERGGDGVIGDLLSHGVDLVRYLLGDVERLVADSAIFIPERPVATGSGSHYAIGGAGPAGSVQNLDYAACMMRTTADVPVFLEGSRVAVGRPEQLRVRDPRHSRPHGVGLPSVR